MNAIQKLLTENQDYLFVIVFSLCGGFARIAIGQAKELSFVDIMKEVFLALFSGLIVFCLFGYRMERPYLYGVIGLSGMASREILTLRKELPKLFRAIMNSRGEDKK